MEHENSFELTEVLNRKLKANIYAGLQRASSSLPLKFLAYKRGLAQVGVSCKIAKTKNYHYSSVRCLKNFPLQKQDPQTFTMDQRYQRKEIPFSTPGPFLCRAVYDRSPIQQTYDKEAANRYWNQTSN